MRTTAFLIGAFMLGSIGCSDAETEDGTVSASAGGGTAGAGGAGGGDALAWQTLITADWELEPFSEDTSDIHAIVIDRDIYVGAIRPISPKGTHHTLLSLEELGAANIIYGSGVGTNALTFPPGVGLKLEAGTTLLLELHLLNTSGEILTGTSGIEIVEVAPADVQHEADVLLPGPLSFQIPPNETHSETGTCTVQSTQSFFAILPHMHQLGRHLKTTLTIAGEQQVLHDGDYEFQHQPFLAFEPVTLQAGDSITTECTWNNTSQASIGWGPSSNDEMCFSILYRFPKVVDVGGGFCDDSM